MLTLHEFSTIAKEYLTVLRKAGWFHNRRVTNVLEATLASLLLYDFRLNRFAKDNNLLEISEQIRSLHLFGTNFEKLDLLLSLLHFRFDKDVLKASRDLICEKCDGTNFTEPKPFVGTAGISIVMFFEYDDDYEQILEDRVNTSNQAQLIETTAQPHFTVANIGLGINNSDVLQMCDVIKKQLQKKWLIDANFKGLVKSLCKKACLQDKMWILPDGAIVLFGCGDFLVLMHELQKRLRSDLLTFEPDFDQANQPIWSHTVPARFIAPLAKKALVAKQALENVKSHFNSQQTGHDKELINTRLSLMVFHDEKALGHVDEIRLFK